MKTTLRFPRTLIPALALLPLLLASSGCATRNTSSGSKETHFLGGAVTVVTDSFQPTNPATLDVDTSKLDGKTGPSGKKTSLLWGLITLHNY